MKRTVPNFLILYQILPFGATQKSSDQHKLDVLIKFFCAFLYQNPAFSALILQCCKILACAEVSKHI